MWGDEAAERHEMDEPSEPLAVDGTPRMSMALPSGRTVSGSLGSELRELEIYARERASEVRGQYKDTEASRSYIDMADRIKAIRGEA